MYERELIRQIAGYIPGAQPDGSAIKLNTNENPIPPSPRVMARLADIQPSMLQRYPDPSAAAFRDAVARIHGLASVQVVATNGGDELLRLAFATFSDPDRPVGIVSPGYGLYSVLADLHQAPTIDVPLTETWQLPKTASTSWNAAGAQLAFLTTPCSFGNSLSRPPHRRSGRILSRRARSRRGLCRLHRPVPSL